LDGAKLGTGGLALSARLSGSTKINNKTLQYTHKKNTDLALSATLSVSTEFNRKHCITKFDFAFILLKPFFVRATVQISL